MYIAQQRARAHSPLCLLGADVKITDMAHGLLFEHGCHSVFNEIGDWIDSHVAGVDGASCGPIDVTRSHSAIPLNRFKDAVARVTSMTMWKVGAKNSQGIRVTHARPG